jgi:hypothetical protein
MQGSLEWHFKYMFDCICIILQNDKLLFDKWHGASYMLNDQINRLLIRGIPNMYCTCVLYEQLSSIYRLNLYALFINGEKETALYRQ